jgi:NhaP-type Na+/H+ or K+/H+ antiporter
MRSPSFPHEHAILLAIYLTVGVSVFAHGLTAAPLAERYGRWSAAHPRGWPEGSEAAPMAETRTRGTAGLAGRAQAPL